jgi:N-acetylmuramoyl-L-alanine amidase
MRLGEGVTSDRVRSRTARLRRRVPPAQTGLAFALSLAGLLVAACGDPGLPSGGSHSATSTIKRSSSAITSTTIETAPSTAAAPPSSTVIASTTTTPSLSPGQPLAGKVVGIDPGHNGLNYSDPSYLAKQVWNGREEESCDTTGTETASGYTEAQFNFDVAQYLSADLQAEGARVVMTRSSNNGVGPCVDQRAQILNAAGSDVAIDIHADGGPPTGRGFTILEPVADGPNDAVISSSDVFGNEVKSSYLSVTGMPVSTYDGTDGISYRDDLAGLNLTTVPKVLIECGNMRNSTDAALLASASFQEGVANALAEAITHFLSTAGG